jgi:hypothetical protein
VKRRWAPLQGDHIVVGRRGLIPATLKGLEAIAETLGNGISGNVTLIFSLERYRAVINAFPCPPAVRGDLE